MRLASVVDRGNASRALRALCRGARGAPARLRAVGRL